MKNKKVQELIKAAKKTNEELIKKYFPDKWGIKITPLPDDHRIYTRLESDIESVLTCSDNLDEAFDDVKEFVLNVTIIGKEISDKINWSHIYRAAEIRHDWATALRGVKKGTALSSSIDWHFSSEDIRALAKLHKANKFREKIEDLLEDCNYHYECGEFADKEYDEFLEAANG